MSINMNSNLFFGGGNQNFFADYASLRNGSYGRLMKAYYGRGNDIGSVSVGSTSNRSNSLEKFLEERRNPKVSKEVQEANANLTGGISTLKNVVNTLQNDSTYKDTTNGASATDKVVSALKDYVAQYNNVVMTAKHSTLSKTSHVAGMMRSTTENADKLEEMGIMINSNGTLRVNAGKLKEVDISKVQELFAKDDLMSYGSTVMSRLQFVGAASGTTSTDNDKTDTKPAGYAAASLKTDSELLASDKLFAMIKDKDGNETYDIDKILSTAKSFVNNYNKMFDEGKSSMNSGVSSNLSRIKEKTEQNADVLKQFGIDIDKNGRLNLDADTLKASNMSDLQAFFKDYGSSIATSASLVNYYMTTQANASSGYTASGAYNAQGSVRYTDFI